MEIISNQLQEYLTQHSDNEPDILQELTRETHLRILQPHMLSGHYQGRLLSMISKIKNPKSILEIGTFTGYATLCLAEGLSDEGIIHTIDINEELQDIQRRYFDKSGYGKQIVQHLGDAMKIIPTLNTTFDLVFMDGDKKNYCEYFEVLVPMMNKGGILLSDNVLWKGRVIDKELKNDKQTRFLMDYNQKIQQDSRVETVVLPIRDGLSIARII